MKVFVVLSVLIAAAYTKPGMPAIFNDPTVHNWSDECVKESNADLSIYANLQPGDHPPEIDHNIKCYNRCMQLKTRLIDSEGQPNFDEIKIVFNIKNDAVLEEAMKCSSDNADLCDKNHEISKCILETLKPPVLKD